VIAFFSSYVRLKLEIIAMVEDGCAKVGGMRDGALNFLVF